MQQLSLDYRVELACFWKFLGVSGSAFPEAPDIRFCFCLTACSSESFLFHSLWALSHVNVSQQPLLNGPDLLLCELFYHQSSNSHLSALTIKDISSEHGSPEFQTDMNYYHGHCRICIFRQLKHNLFHLNLSHVPPRLFLNRCRISQSMGLVFHPVSQPDLIFFVTFSPSVSHIQSVLFFKFSLVIFLFNSPILPPAVAYFRLLTSLSQTVVVILTGLLVWGVAVIWAILYITWRLSV